MSLRTAKDLGMIFNQFGYEGEMLHSAAIFDNDKLLFELLEAGVHGNLDSTDNWGRTPLHTAASHGSLKCVKLLLQRGADPNSSSGIEDKCYTPVHHAAQQDHFACLNTLLEYEVNLDIKSSQGKKAIDVARDQGNFKCVNLITKVREQQEKNREIAKREELYDFIMDGNFVKSKQTLESIADPYSIVNLYYRGPHTLLYRASMGGFLDIIKLLVDYHADGRANLDSGLTPLYGACCVGHLEVVIYLSRKFPCQLEMPVTVDEYYPLHGAVTKGHTEIVRYLLTLRPTDEQAYIPQEILKDKKPMKTLSKRTSSKTSTDELIKYFVDVNKPMKSGYTPLHLAILYSNIEVVKALLACPRVSRHSENRPPGSLIIDQLANCKTPFHHALVLGKVEIAELLLNHGNDVAESYQDIDGVYTPIHYACVYSSENMVNMLIRKGAVDVDNKGLNGAVEKCRDDIVNILLSNGVHHSVDGKIALAANEVPLDLKPVLIEWTHRQLYILKEVWLYHAAYSYNLHAAEKLNSDPGLKLKIFTSIDLSYNHLKSVPAVLFQLPSLKHLNISSNKLKLLPGSIEDCDEVSLCENNWNCPSLEDVELHHNELELPPKLLFLMPMLQSINLGWNKISKLPFEMWNAPRLKTLILEHNMLEELPCFSNSSNKSTAINHVKADIRVKSNPVRNGQHSVDGKKVDFATLSQVYSKRPTWDGDSDDSDDEDVDFLNKSGLNKLDLSGNKFSRLPVGLPCLAPNLSRLLIGKNKIGEINSIHLLPSSLTTLDLSQNCLKVFDISLANGEDFHVCYAVQRRNSYSRPLSYPNSKPRFCLHCKHRQLSDLTRLVLSDNQLENIFLSHRTVKGNIDIDKVLFPELKTLDISKNKLSKVPVFIGRLSKLCTLSIEHNVDIDVLPSELGLCTELYDLKFDGLNIKDPPKNIIEKRTNDGRRDIHYLTGYLKSLHDNAQPYPNIKLMVVGVFGIGKTSLLESIRKEGSGAYQQSDFKSTFNERRMNEKLTKTSNQSTVGVDICDWQYHKKYQRGASIKFTTWDFGGQTEYYATHQCFLSRRAIYLLVWKLTDGVQGINQMEQWLLNIQERAPNSTVIIVGTFLDEIKKKDFIKEMQEKIKAKYMSTKYGGSVLKLAEKGLPNVVAMVEVSCKTDTNISKLRELIYDTVMSLKSDGKEGQISLVEKRIPASYIAIEKAVTTIAENMKNEMPVLEELQFRAQVFEQLKMQGFELRNGNEELAQAVQFLHDYGIILHYDDPALRDLYFVDPQWLCDMLAHVVTVKCVNPCIKNGVLKISDLKNQIFHGEKRFPSSMVTKYVNLMSKFEVAIKISDKFLLIPSLLPDRQKECPVVCDIESPELRKAMNIHAYLNYQVFRRLYLISYVPSGFWARLLTRLIADDRICKIVSSCCLIQGCGDLESNQAHSDAETLMRAAPPEWACWKTGIELSCFGTKLLRVCQLESDKPFYGSKGGEGAIFVKSLNSDGMPKVAVEILAPSITLNIEKFIQYREKENGDGESLVGFRVIGINESYPEAACRLLVLTVEHIDSLFAEWFPNLDDYTNIQGVKAVRRVSFCDLCLAKTIENMADDNHNVSLTQESDWIQNIKGSVVHPNEDNEMKVYTPDRLSMSKSFSIESIVEVNISDVEDKDSHDSDSSYAMLENIEELSNEEVELNKEYRRNAKGCIIVFELEEASKLLRENKPLICPFHGKADFGLVFPDLHFRDLEKKYIISPSRLKQGKYIAEGAFGDIFKAEIDVDGELNPVAMKIPKGKKKELMATLFSYDSYRNIRQEIAILRTIKHPYIIDFVGISLSPFAMLLELAPCGSLDSCYMEYQRKGKKLNPHVIQKILHQISAGLKYLHRKHIIYRDIKCENVLVWVFPSSTVSDMCDSPVMIKLTDYGISRAVSLSGTKGYMGTPGYMAPEILRYTGKESYTEKVDCFSYGSLIYELVALKPPFNDMVRNKASLASRYMLEGKRPRLTSSEKRYPVLLLSLMYRCWAQNPDDRPSASEINSLTALEEFSKIIDISGIGENFRYQCEATTNQSQFSNTVADTQSVIGSHLWLCGSQDSFPSRSQGGHIIVSSYHENKYMHIRNIKITERILMVCTVGSTVWLGTETGTIQVFCALQFYPLALGRVHCHRYILRIIHSPACHSVFVALDDGTVHSYYDNLSNYKGKLQESDVSKFFFVFSKSNEIRELTPNNIFTGNTEIHCLVGVTSHVKKRYCEENVVVDYPDRGEAVSSMENMIELSTFHPETCMEKSYELWCGQGKGTILILDMLSLKKMDALSVTGHDIADPKLKGLSVKFMKTSQSYDSTLHDQSAKQNSEDNVELNSQHIWVVAFPGTEVARWNVDKRTVEKTFDAAQHSPTRDLNSSKLSVKTKALQVSRSQISALAVVEETMYVGTTFGCLIVCDAFSMIPRFSVRCYEDYIETIIPLRMICGRNRYENGRKLVMTCGRNCLDSWIDRKKRLIRNELTMLTWNIM